MEIYEFKRAVRLLGDVSIDDQAIIVSRMTKGGAIITANCGNTSARVAIQSALRVIPMSAPAIITNPRKEGTE